MRKYLILLFGLLLLICSGSCNLYPLYLKRFMEKYNLTIRQVNIYGACINIGLWVAFPTGIFYDKYGPKRSLLLGLFLLPGCYLLIHFLINSSLIPSNFPFFFLALLALFLGQGSAILHTTAFSLNINNFNFKDSSLIVSMLALNMSIGPSLFAFFKENISFFGYENFYVFLSLFLATIIVICVFLFKDYSDDKNDLDENSIKLKIDKEIFFINKIYSCNIFICVSFILTLILSYAGFIFVKRIMVIAMPIMILFQFLYFYFNYKFTINNQALELDNKKLFELNNKSLQSEEMKEPQGDSNRKLDENYRDLGLITREKSDFSKENSVIKIFKVQNEIISSDENKRQKINLLKSEVNFENNLSNEILSNNVDHVIEIRQNNNLCFLFLLFCVLVFGMGSIISNYNNIHFLVDSLYELEHSDQISSNKTTQIRNMQSEEKIILIFEDLSKNITINLNESKLDNYKFNSLNKTDILKDEAIINRDQFIKKKIFFYIIVYYTCNGITRLFSNSILQMLIRKDKMFYHLLLTSSLGLVSQFLGMLMKKDLLLLVIALCGTCHGFYMTFVPIFVKKFFNHKDFGKIMGFLTTGSALGSLINSNFLFIYSYEKYGFNNNKESNYKTCRESYCFSYSYLMNMTFFSINVLIAIVFIIKRKNLIIIK